MKTFYCRGCIAQGKKKLKRYIGYKVESNTHFTYKFVCNGLSRHIDANDNCFNYYHDNNLMELSSSVKEDTTIPQATHTAEQYGLTLSGNGPRIPTLQTDTTTTATSSKTIHSVLNPQVIHNVFIPPMDRTTIKSHLRNSNFDCNNTVNNNNNDNVDSDDDNDNNNNNNDNNDGGANFDNSHDNDSSQHTSTILNDREKVFRHQITDSPSPQLTAEINLINLMTKHKLPLSTFKSIFQWAKQSQNLLGFDFSTTPIRTRESIFKEIKTNLAVHDSKFHPKITNWLPDNKPTQIFVRSFYDALYSLLTNRELMTDQNLSFPDCNTPLSPQNFPELTEATIISELHHGTWWTESWKQLCAPNTSEILVPIIFYMDGISLDAHGRLTLTPLNMTLGIFNVETRKKSDAW
eukprot:CAMPEP_0172379242 /NCGR_PEP_ID=MMETSP1060-20121228/69828_1 /TAXON_ID=37318 /ORGANISM="Pseudo-nitzschia pungens, Strain cf. cingulata" /LENGTH=405 /DNA_ID=CAMNT_0013106979 /DNA_START=256 /DNA_END=1470 /DNA_ORIENTATION=+